MNPVSKETPMLPTALRLALCLAALAGAGPAAAQAPRIEQAHQAYHFARYAQSLALYEQFAAQGDAEAAERAGYMLMQGPAAYGPGVPRDVPRATAWLEQAARAGRPHASFVLGMGSGSD
jgi:TPR repeat protein